MLKTISWNTYLLWLSAALILYYTILVYRYHKKEMLGLLKGQRPAKDSAEPDTQTGETPELFKATTTAIAGLKEQLQAVGNNRPEAIAQIKQVLQKYRYLKGTPYSNAVNNFIVKETNTTVRLKEDEVNGLWD